MTHSAWDFPFDFTHTPIFHHCYAVVSTGADPGWLYLATAVQLCTPSTPPSVTEIHSYLQFFTVLQKLWITLAQDRAAILVVDGRSEFRYILARNRRLYLYCRPDAERTL